MLDVEMPFQRRVAARVYISFCVVFMEKIISINLIKSGFD